MKLPPYLHPLLFSFYPVIFLYSANPALFRAEVMLGTAALSVLLTAIGWLALGSLFRNKNKAALMLSSAILLSFSYGVLHVVLARSTLRVGAVVVGPQAIALLICAALFVLALAFCMKTKRRLAYLTAVANVAAVVLVTMSAGGTVFYKAKNHLALKKRNPWRSVETVCGPSRAPVQPPNVYYIILDAYGRSDVLKDLYRYDNRELIDYLKARGFYIAEGSRSGYIQTILSLASSLNFEYIHDLIGRFEGKVDDRGPLIEAIRNSRLSSLFRRHGYSVAAFSTGIFATEVRGADTYLSRPWFLNEFENGLLLMTPLPAVLAQFGWHHQYDLHRRRILFNLSRLVEISRRQRPQFVFAHFLIPHPPFVFGERGEPVNPKRPFDLADGSDLTGEDGARRPEYLEDYRRQAVFISGEIRRAIEAILVNSPAPPIILLQSDHGPGALLNLGGSLRENPCLKERFGILNACLLPSRDYQDFYHEMSAINTWRLVLNKTFGTRCTLLPDESYFSNWDEPYKFARVSGDIGCDTKLAAGGFPPTNPAADR